MIVLTAGAQLPFERLAEVALSSARAFPQEAVVYQAGPSGSGWFEGREVPTNLTVEAFMAPARHRALLDEARIVVTHAGMGNILYLLERARPLLIFPRLKRHGEHRSDHQLATARALHERHGLAFYTEAEPLLAQLGKKPQASGNHEMLDAIERRRRELGQRLQSVLDGWNL